MSSKIFWGAGRVLRLDCGASCCHLAHLWCFSKDPLFPPVPDSELCVTLTVITRGALQTISGCAAASADATTRSGACPGLV